MQLQHDAELWLSWFGVYETPRESRQLDQMKRLKLRRITTLLWLGDEATSNMEESKEHAVLGMYAFVLFLLFLLLLPLLQPTDPKQPESKEELVLNKDALLCLPRNFT